MVVTVLAAYLLAVQIGAFIFGFYTAHVDGSDKLKALQTRKWFRFLNLTSSVLVLILCLLILFIN